MKNKLLFGNKADTLASLEGKTTYSKVLPQINFSVSEWDACNNTVSKINNGCLPNWFNDSVIVRSSSATEDSDSESLAGHFTSILNVRGNANIDKAISEVVSSFTGSLDNNFVFIQPFLDEVLISGVAFTIDPNNNGYYYVVNYDVSSGNTNSVTGGTTNTLKTVYVAKGHPDKSGIPWLSNLMLQLIELENKFDNTQLDIEFAIDKNNILYVLQVRPLVLNKTPVVSFDEFNNALLRINDRIQILNKAHPYLHGQKTMFGVMPDWNPAEIIGIRPRPLSLSLYKELITDGVWAFQRNNYGYKNLRSFPLLHSFEGQPFVDVRVSFNSFIPNNICDELADKLVDYYIQALHEDPSYHDKVEFEIIFSCYTFDLTDKVEKLKENGFTDKECNNVTDSLLLLTNKIINNDDGLWVADIKKLDELNNRHEVIVNSDLSTLDKVYWLIEDCKRYGTLPFAGLARAGFVAVQLLRSMESVGILSKLNYDNFMLSLTTISSSLSNDFIDLNRAEFLEKYGHLRPGTYDVLSARYDENPDLYFEWAENKVDHTDDSMEFGFTLETHNEISHLLKEHGLNHDSISLFNFIKGAIEGREYAKFIFTKNLSYCIKLLTEIGNEYGLTQDDISYLDYSIIKQLYSTANDREKEFKASIVEGKSKYTISSIINLPPLITSNKDVYFFEIPEAVPNFITQNKVVASVICDIKDHRNLSGKIAFITSADPGFDWIFTKNIVGFVTMYGGTNSHMAIRANELGLPAVIGAGELLYKKYKNAKILEIDCPNKRLSILQ